MKHENAAVLWNRKLTQSVFRIGIECGSHYQDSRPGQFVTLKLPGEDSPLLRRPFSIHRLIHEKGSFKGIEILYKTVGGFTVKLAGRLPGSRVDVLGPLGKGFTVSGSFGSSVIAAGGMGVAPMLFLAESLAGKGLPPEKAGVCIGGGSADDVLCLDEFRSLGIKPLTASEDGSIGEKGLVTDILEKELERLQPGIVYACGPFPMLRAVSESAARHGIECEVSIETMMACGVGACLGCAVEDSMHPGGYGHVCVDGPVFNTKRLNLE